MKKEGFSWGIVALILTFLMTIGPINGVSNVTCNGNGDAVIFRNITIDTTNVLTYEVEDCGALACVADLGCIDPRNTPGEVFLSSVILLIAGSFLFAYLALRTTSKEYAPMRLLFFFLSFIMIMAGTFHSYNILNLLGFSTLSTPFLGIFSVFSGVFLFLIYYQVIPFIRWAAKQLMNHNKDQEITDVT